MVLLVAYVLKIFLAMVAIQGIVLITIGAKTEKCSQEKGIEHCYECTEDCRKGLLGKIKPYTFNLFIKQYGEEKLLNCLERNEQNGVVYHREGVNGDYDDFDDVETLINFIYTGKR